MLYHLRAHCQINDAHNLELGLIEVVLHHTIHSEFYWDLHTILGAELHFSLLALRGVKHLIKLQALEFNLRAVIEELRHSDPHGEVHLFFWRTAQQLDEHLGHSQLLIVYLLCVMVHPAARNYIKWRGGPLQDGVNLLAQELRAELYTVVACAIRFWEDDPVICHAFALHFNCLSHVECILI